jgi:hypothetical protein
LQRHLDISARILAAEMLKIARATVRSLKDLEVNTVCTESDTMAVGLSNIPEDAAAALNNDTHDGVVSSTATQHLCNRGDSSFTVEPSRAADWLFMPEEATTSSSSGAAHRGGCTEDPFSEDESSAPAELYPNKRTLFRFISGRRGYSTRVPVEDSALPMAGVSEESIELPQGTVPATTADGQDMASLLDALETVCKEVRHQFMVPWPLPCFCASAKLCRAAACMRLFHLLAWVDSLHCIISSFPPPPHVVRFKATCSIMLTQHCRAVNLRRTFRTRGMQ